MIFMSMVEDLRSMLIAHGIDATSYTDGMLESFILEAKVLVDEPFMFDEITEDYDPMFHDDVYITSNYPLVEVMKLTINDKIVIPEYTSPDGILFLDKPYHGKLKCKYKVGLTNDDVQSYLLPIVVGMVQEKEGMNVASISEGDVSIGYDTANGYGSQVSQLVQTLKNKYNGRVVFI